MESIDLSVTDLAHVSDLDAKCLVQGGEYRRNVDETDELTDEQVQVGAKHGSRWLTPPGHVEPGRGGGRRNGHKEWTRELCEIRRMVEFLVRRERKLDVKTDVAVRRLERLEKENGEKEDEEREASLTEALSDTTKVAKLVVDKLVRRQRLWLWQGPHRRDRLHPRKRCGRCRGLHDRHRRVGASRERRRSSPGRVSSTQSLGACSLERRERTRRGRTRLLSK